MEDGSTLDYDVLSVNVGSKTRGTKTVPGIWEHSLTTRPINELLPKIHVREQQLKEAGIVPKVVVCGAGAAGVELAFGFKSRWSQVFGEEIHVTLVSADDVVLKFDNEAVRANVMKKLAEKNIHIVTEG
jgi:NADH dehydrogenase FAD-containing subunit